MNILNQYPGALFCPFADFQLNFLQWINTSYCDDLAYIFGILSKPCYIYGRIHALRALHENWLTLATFFKDQGLKINLLLSKNFNTKTMLN